MGFPKGCGQSNSKCDYFLGINTNSKDSTLLDVTLVGKANGWVAVGFSQTPDMVILLKMYICCAFFKAYY